MRYVLFGFVWLITVGKHHFWLLPNLTEDCGFFESFVPLYTHTLAGTKEEGDGETEKSDDKDDKDDNDGTSKDKQEEGNKDERTPKDTKDEEEKEAHEGDEG